jgi:hypothetical protein
MEDDDRDLSWQKPDWTKNTKLRPTGKADKLKEGDLAKPITMLPHMKEDGPFEKPQWTGEVKQEKNIADPAKPITSLPHAGETDLSFQKPDWTKENKLRGTGKGDALKSGKEIARPIGGIKPVEDE